MATYYPISEDAAKRAKAANSWSDYISRKAAIKALWNHEKTTRHNLSIYPDIVSEHCEVILDVPAADVRPVVRGEWRYKTMTVPGGKGQTYAKWGCSKCKSKFKDRSNFCPNCGADMRPAEMEASDGT